MLPWGTTISRSGTGSEGQRQVIFDNDAVFEVVTYNGFYESWAYKLYQKVGGAWKAVCETYGEYKLSHQNLLKMFSMFSRYRIQRRCSLRESWPDACLIQIVTN
jgi:hypothetical protein